MPSLITSDELWFFSCFHWTEQPSDNPYITADDLVMRSAVNDTMTEHFARLRSDAVVTAHGSSPSKSYKEIMADEGIRWTGNFNEQGMPVGRGSWVYTPKLDKDENVSVSWTEDGIGNMIITTDDAQVQPMMQSVTGIDYAAPGYQRIHVVKATKEPSANWPVMRNGQRLAGSTFPPQEWNYSFHDAGGEREAHFEGNELVVSTHYPGAFGNAAYRDAVDAHTSYLKHNASSLDTTAVVNELVACLKKTDISVDERIAATVAACNAGIITMKEAREIIDRLNTCERQSK